MTFNELCIWIKDQVMQCTVMLTINQGHPSRLVNQGTGLLLATDQAEMLVTCGHVYDEFLKLRAADATTILAMSGAQGKAFMDISAANVLGIGSDLDLATLSIRKEDVILTGKGHVHYPRWPGRRAEKGMLGYLIGYPGQLLILESGLAIKPLMEFTRPVVSVSDRHFILHDEDGDAVMTYADNTPTVTALGGISGCAVWIYDHNIKSNKAELFVGGFAYQARGVDTVLVVHADFINADGSIR